MCENCRYPGELAQQEPFLIPDEEEAQAAEWEREHAEQVHGGGECTCPPPFLQVSSAAMAAGMGE